MTQGAAKAVIQVVVELPQHTGLRQGLSYQSAEPLTPGTLVRVPLGRREVPGIVWDAAGPESAARAAEAASDRPAAELKPIAEAWTELEPLTPSWRQLIGFAADYYQRGIGELALSALPPELRKASRAALARRCTRLKRDTEKRAPEVAPDPTPEQDAVLAEMAHVPRTTPVLLHGATGSGKTEVYLRRAQQALEAGQQVLVMVPEINLTPQLEARLRQRFSDRLVVTLHSGLTPAQRLNHWLLAHLGRADLVLGTRMSVLASLPRLGLIVVDEEHDPSFKQQEGARYSARDLAVYRGHLERVPVILGSATPALETWRQAQQGRYRRLSMPTRVGGGALPRVRLIDLALAPKAQGGGATLSPSLVAAVQERIDRGEQSLLLLNRRGYAPVLHCTACAWKSGCPHCSAWQVFHKIDRSLRCHHCGAAQRVPRACPDCGNLDLGALGRGTERLEEQLPPLLRGRDDAPPRILRIDADTTRHAGELESHLRAVHEGEVDVLVGTQMVAKGHDFRSMTLVAAVNPDGGLFSSDFRAPERLFALLMQAAGRAGRDAAQAARSEMLVQTWNPGHALYQALLRHDYEAFAQAQLDERQAVGLPPFSHLALLRVEARTVEAAAGFLQDAADAARAQLLALGLADGRVTVYPPVPATVARVANLERMQLLVESASRVALQALLRAWNPDLLSLRERHRPVMRWALDVDPLGL